MVIKNFLHSIYILTSSMNLEAGVTTLYKVTLTK